MFQLLLTLSLVANLSPVMNSAQASELRATVTDVTAEYQTIGLGAPTPTPAPTTSVEPPRPNGGITSTHGIPTPTPSISTTTTTTTTANPSPTPHSTPGIDLGSLITGTTAPKPGGIDLNTLITLGGKVWDYVVNNKPTATYQVFKSAIVPGGVTNWTQLRGWKHPVSKVYRVEFKNVFNRPAGGFDYRITYVPGGSFQGKGKFLGEINVVPLNVKLQTDRSINFHAEISEPLNYGTENDPVAAAQLTIMWNSPTTLRFTGDTPQYFIYGTGEIEDLSHGN